MGRAETSLQSLIERARCADRDAFDELVRRYADMAFRYAISLVGDYGLAEDATQEALASAYFGLSTLRDETAFPAWLRGIVRNQCLRLVRGRRPSLVPLEAIGDVPSAGPTPHDGAERAEMRRGVLRAVMLLPQHLREVVILFYGGGYSQRQLASFLDLPVTTVNNRLHAARRQLRGGLIEMIHDDAERHPLPGEFAERIGRIIDSRGPLLRADFASGDAPRPLDSMTSDDGLTYAVMQQLAGGIVRCIALQPRGGAQGRTLADGGRIVDRAVSPDVLRHAVAILLDEAPLTTGIVETGIKAIDLFAPLPAEGPIGLYGAQGRSSCSES